MTARRNRTQMVESDHENGRQIVRSQATHRPEAHPDSELIEGLEPDQLVVTSSVPLPPMRLSRSAWLALWILRIFVMLMGALVIYTFLANLGGRQ